MADTRTIRPARRQDPRRCADCGEPIRWWRNSRDLDRWVCVDFSSDDDGTVQKLIGRDPGTRKTVPVACILTGLDLAAARADGRMLFPLHTVTCSARRPAPTSRRTTP